MIVIKKQYIFPDSNFAAKSAEEGCFYGENAFDERPIFYDRRKANLPNGLFLGASGTGKSFVMRNEIAQTIFSTDDDIIIADISGDMCAEAPFINLLGGTVCNIATGEFHINPLDLVVDTNELSSTDCLAEKRDFVVHFIKSMLQDRDLNSFEILHIYQAVNDVYEVYFKSVTGKSKYYLFTPTLSDVYRRLKAYNLVGLGRIVKGLMPYCEGENAWFSHQTNIPTSRLIAFDFPCAAKVHNAYYLSVISYMKNRLFFNHYTNDERNKTKHLWLYVELYPLKYNSTSEEIHKLQKESRTKGGVFTGYSNSGYQLLDIIESPYGAAIVGHTSFFMLLNHSKLGRDSLKEYLNVSDEMLTYLANTRCGQGLLYSNQTLIPFDFYLDTSSSYYSFLAGSREIKPLSKLPATNYPPEDVSVISKTTKFETKARQYDTKQYAADLAERLASDVIEEAKLYGSADDNGKSFTEDFIREFMSLLNKEYPTLDVKE